MNFKMKIRTNAYVLWGQRLWPQIITRTNHQIKLVGTWEFLSFKKPHSAGLLIATAQSQRSFAITWLSTSKRPSAAECWGTVRRTVTLRKDSLPQPKVLLVSRKCLLGSKKYTEQSFVWVFGTIMSVFWHNGHHGLLLSGKLNSRFFPSVAGDYTFLTRFLRLLLEEHHSFISTCSAYFSFLIKYFCCVAKRLYTTCQPSLSLGLLSSLCRFSDILFITVFCFHKVELFSVGGDCTLVNGPLLEKQHLLLRRLMCIYVFYSKFSADVPKHHL